MISTKTFLSICLTLTLLLLCKCVYSTTNAQDWFKAIRYLNRHHADTQEFSPFYNLGKENSTTEEDPRLSAPWVVSIFQRENENEEFRYHCSGTLTASFVVITSASCVSSKMEENDIMYHKNYTNLKVYAGLSSIAKNYSAIKDMYTQESEVSLVREHKPPKNHNSSTHFQIYHVPANLAGIILKTEFNFTEYVQPARIPKSSIVVGEDQTCGVENAVFAGFNLNPLIPRSDNETQLQRFNLTIIGNSWCRNTYLRHTSYFNVVCGHLSGYVRKAIPCFMEGAGLVTYVQEPGYLGPKIPFLTAVYTSNTATLHKKTDPYPISVLERNTQCTQSDVAFFTKHGEYFEWARSQSHCGPRFLPCQDGGCYPPSYRCDAVVDCMDESDESDEVCKNQKTCAQDEFKCGNGVCIAGYLVCNGYKNCLDNSDESDEQKCRQRAQKSNFTCSSIPIKEGVTTLCMLPNHLGGTLTENCNGKAVPVGTTALQYCSKYYRGEVQGSLKCFQNQTWSSSGFLKCESDCGLSEPIDKNNRNEMNVTKYGQWPWHVTIYKLNGTEGELICGGSLISTKVVLTAAHCVAEKEQNIPKNKSMIGVVMGKILRGYNKKENDTQYRQIKKIIIHESYIPNKYEGDIAMIVLESPVSITHTVRPVCYSANDTSDKENSMENGTAVGFGDERLESIQLSLLPQKACLQKFPNLKKFRDKVICANETGENSICNGHSGSGFVFPRYNSYSENRRYFVYGIVSHGSNENGNPCNNEPNVFTKVAPYRSWIDETVNKKEGPKPDVWHQIRLGDGSGLLVWNFTQDNDNVYKLQVVFGDDDLHLFKKGGKLHDDSLWMLKESGDTGFFTLVNKNLPNAVVTSYGNSTNGHFVVLIDEKQHAAEYTVGGENEEHVLWKFEPRGDTSLVNIYNQRFSSNGIMAMEPGTNYVEIYSHGLVKEQQKEDWKSKWKFMEDHPDGDIISRLGVVRTRVWYQIHLESAGLMALSDTKAEGGNLIQFIKAGNTSEEYRKAQQNNPHNTLWMFLKAEEPGYYTLINKNRTNAVVTARGDSRRGKWAVLIDERASGEEPSAKGDYDERNYWKIEHAYSYYPTAGEPPSHVYYNIVNRREHNGYITQGSRGDNDGLHYVKINSELTTQDKAYNPKYRWKFTQVSSLPRSNVQTVDAKGR